MAIKMVESSTSHNLASNRSSLMQGRASINQGNKEAINVNKLGGLNMDNYTNEVKCVLINVLIDQEGRKASTHRRVPRHEKSTKLKWVQPEQTVPKLT
eukprot:4590319-Amphidinium_carterae.1